MAVKSQQKATKSPAKTKWSLSKADIERQYHHVLPRGINIDELIEELQKLSREIPHEIILGLDDSQIFSAIIDDNGIEKLVDRLKNKKPDGLLNDRNRLTAITVQDSNDPDVLAEKERLLSVSAPNFWKLSLAKDHGSGALARMITEGEMLAKLVLRSKGASFNEMIVDPYPRKPGILNRWAGPLQAFTRDSEGRFAEKVLHMVEDLTYRYFVEKARSDSMHSQMILFGMLVERLYQNRAYGEMISRRKRATSKIKKNKAPPEIHKDLVAHYKKIRPEFGSNAEAYRAAAAKFPSLSLSEHQVRHLIHPTRK